MARRGENIYKRKDGRYEGRFIKGRTIHGKTLFGYRYGYTYAEVKNALILAKAATCRDARICVIGKGSLGEFLEFWLNSVIKDQVKPSTFAQYYERIYTHIVPALGHLPVCRLSKEHVQNFADNLRKSGLAASTVRNIAGLLCAAMKKAVSLHLSHTNPCKDISLPPENTTERRALNRAEQIRLERLLPQMDNGTRLGVLLGLYAGLRIGEICALRWRDIDLATGTITVRGTIQRMKNLEGGTNRTKLTEGAPKSRRSLRKIPLPAGVIEKLRHNEGSENGENYVLTNTKKPIEPHTLRVRFNRLTAKAGLDITFHCLRHTYVTRCLEHNFDIQTVSELLGHATAGVTMKVYAHSVLEHKRQLTSRIQILSEHNEPSNEPSNKAASQ